MTPDIHIIGSGVIGLMTARALKMTGCSVTVLERGCVGTEASWAGGGILSPLYPWRYPEAVTRLAGLGQGVYPRLCQELAEDTGIDPEWMPSGLMVLGADDGPDATAWADRHGIEMVHLDERGAREIEPELNGIDGPVLWMPDIAQVRNPRLLKALRADLIRRGVIIEEHAEVLEVIMHDGQVTGLRTNAGRRPVGKLVVAAGAWTAQLLAGAGVWLPVVPVRGQMLLYKAPVGLVSRIVLNRDRYLIPRRDGRVLAGSTLEHAGYDKSTTDSAREDLQRAAIGLVPGLADCPIETQWAGLRPGSQSDVPWVCDHPEIRGLYISSGHYRNGLVLAPGSAQLLGALITGHRPPLDPAPFGIRR